MARVYNVVLYEKLSVIGPRMAKHVSTSEPGDAIHQGMLMLINQGIVREKVLGHPNFTVMEALIVEGGRALEDKYKQEMHITVEINDCFLSIDERCIKAPNNS